MSFGDRYQPGQVSFLSHYVKGAGYQCLAIGYINLDHVVKAAPSRFIHCKYRYHFYLFFFHLYFILWKQVIQFTPHSRGRVADFQRNQMFPSMPTL